ncbi:MAG: hypothetical protein E6G66_19535 [Actinobacteria bacterium]|nr:MAG: hypothetical protein E6G66_19535 [Actinomycetota bacterium]
MTPRRSPPRWPCGGAASSAGPRCGPMWSSGSRCSAGWVTPRRNWWSGGGWRWPASATTTPAGSAWWWRSPRPCCGSGPTRSGPAWPAGVNCWVSILRRDRRDRRPGPVRVLRIEDTDVERSRQEWILGIQSTLRWLGLDWDEGPYLQSARFDRHLEAARRLLESGAAYECFCTEEEITARYEARKALGPADPGYDGHCRSLTAAEREHRRAEGRPRSIRFRTPDEGTSSFTDIVRGEVTVPWSTIPDFVIVRTSGAPVFYLANAIDDADTGITHVIRGEDLTDTTHRMLALREALGIPGRPVFAHLPLLVGQDRQKLSKRHGDVALEDCGGGRKPGDRVARRARGRLRPGPGGAVAGLLRLRQAQLDERGVHPGSCAGRVRGPVPAIRRGPVRRPARPGRVRRGHGHRPGAGHHPGRRRRRRLVPLRPRG